MGSGPRNYTSLTIKRLYALSGNKCAFPGCPITFTNSTDRINFSQICHIEDAEEGGRYNPLMTDAQRAGFDNLLLLCPNHHIETNDVDKYPVEALKEMKSNHESLAFNQIISSKPSMLKNTINAISSIDLDAFLEADSLNAFNPRDKIIYNSIKKNASIINDYKVYHSKIDTLYDELEAQGSIKKEKLLSIIKGIYSQVKGRYVLDAETPIDIIKQNADDIFDEVYDELYKKMEGSDFFDEDIILGIRVIVVDAFIRCKILEEPPI